MSVTTIRSSPQPPQRNDVTIDLTLDSEDDALTVADLSSPPPRPARTRHDYDSIVDEFVRAASERQRHESRSEWAASGFQNQGLNLRGVPLPNQEVISLSDAEDDDNPTDDNDFHVQDAMEYNFNPARIRTPTPFHPPSSPEIEIVSERQIPDADRRPIDRPSVRRRTASGQPQPLPAMAAFGLLPDFLRQEVTDFAARVSNVIRDPLRQQSQQRGQQQVRNQPSGNFAIQMNYEHAAFDLGGLEMYEGRSETPQANQEPYKAPPAAKEGFIRTLDEESVVLCPMCGDELAVGDGAMKQQVWVIKGCGHVYCGECATNRHMTKVGKRDKGVVSGKSTPFKVCMVEGCSARVTNKQSMFAIYL
ncbi:hypothetical protein B0A52_09029 [Exophiala mesophila]|uniref:RING-type domain-containing protein n=1 Tax=Exophiala mesophila TaxID=212818 RepID=A0A438MT87_EXOME|nr:hypothetical protein B0A52_09029 [Exophiala mesophila]